MRALVRYVWPALFAVPLWGQENDRPEGWVARFDHAGAPDSALFFVSMEPGWHVTTGPRVILYNPSMTASGEYRLTSEILVFPDPRREAFGIFFGGENLERDSQSYLYFLIRNNGSYLVKHRAGNETHTFIPWTEHSAIATLDGGEDPVKNVLVVEAGADEVGFYVNGEMVNSLPRSDLRLDGVVGLRVNHNLNLHVTSLAVEPRG